MQPELYATQAAIAACHALAPTWDDTNWKAVLSWYDVLIAISDTPVVRLNRVVAVAEVFGPRAGLVALEEVGSMDHSGRIEAVRGDLLFKAGELPEAAAAYRAALARPGNSVRSRYLHQRLMCCSPEGLGADSTRFSPSGES
jgi:RNA polymerase sigma-70 factor (ECF subfamily)